MKRLILALALLGIISNVRADNDVVTVGGKTKVTNPEAACFLDPSGTPIPVSAANPMPSTAIVSNVTVSQAGAAHEANSQVATSTTAGTLIIARPTRRSCLIRNLDSSITVYFGAATVTAGTGMPLKAGESTVVTAVTLWQVIAASGTPTVAVVDEYD